MRKFVLVSLAVFLMTPLLFAGEWEEQVREVKQRIAKLRAEARELDEAGREREARELRERAGALKKRIRSALERRKREDPESMQGVLRGLGEGVKALVALGRHEQAEQLELIAADVKRKLAASGQRRRGADKKQAVGRETLKTMRIALHALLEADKGEAAGRVEQAIGALELRMAGRRDREAQEVQERAPKAGEMAELLAHAAGILEEMNHPELAGLVAKLAKVHKQQWARQRKGPKYPERAGRREEQRGREQREQAERLMERIERLEQRLDEVTALLERLVRQIDRRDG